MAVAHTTHGVTYPAAACAWLACELAGEADWTDHILLCGHVVAGDVVHEARPWVHLRKNGLVY
jgi:flavin reductase (DIM6/NTAB) family NADH-FMN oxidoreductase RutF